MTHADWTPDGLQPGLPDLEARGATAWRVSRMGRSCWTVRQNGAIMAPMNLLPKVSGSRALERLNVRLPQDILEAIDAARAGRAGNISRNTWITEAIREKLERDLNDDNKHNGGHKTHG